jgi:2-oxoglutarate ferredoxin oxidoreductase subunit beta
LILKIVDVVDGDWAAAKVIVHDQTNRAVAHMLVELPLGTFPVALGVIYNDPAPTFESAVVAQNKQASEGKKPDLQKLLSQGQTWQVEKQPHAM